MSYYTYSDFKTELKENSDYIVAVSNAVEESKLHISKVTKKAGIDVESVVVGSSNPKRLTCVIDPKALSQNHACDIDIAIVVNNDLSEEMELKILQQVALDGIVYEDRKHWQSHGYINGFSLAARVVREGEHHDPIEYTKQCRQMNEKEIDAVRELRLFCMRNATYGGYTKGIKGIALEQMVLKWGAFEQIMHQIAEGDANTIPLIENPVNGYNLLNSVAPNVWQRFQKYAQIFCEDNVVREKPYSFENWWLDHQESHILHLDFQESNSDKVFRQTQKFVNRTLHSSRFKKDVREYDIFVIPSEQGNEAFISVSDLVRKDRKVFDEMLLRKWQS